MRRPDGRFGVCPVGAFVAGRGLAVPALAMAMAAGACQSPVSERTEQDLRASVLHAVQREVADAERSPAARTTDRESRISQLEIREEYLREIEEDYNPQRYFAPSFDPADPSLPVEQVRGLLAPDLYGSSQRIVPVTLRDAVRSALDQNLQVQSARITPAVREADVVAAEAAFDWTFFSEGRWVDTDQPQAGPGFLNLNRTVNSDQTLTGAAGLRRNLVSGGQLSVQQDLVYSDLRNSGFGVLPSPNPASTTSLGIQLQQPLLRNFGSDVALAQVRLSRNAERDQIAQLKSTLITTVTEVERAYWDLVRAHRELVIAAKLVERGEKVRDDIKVRRILDAIQAQVADAVAEVESRRGDVLRAQTSLRRASDRFKALINDPSLPVGSEVLAVPVDRALDEPFSFSLLDAVQAALANRPEIDRAVLDIDDASIRTVVAQSERLPQLDLTASVTLLGFDEIPGDAFGDQFRNEFFDNFLLGLVFEQPLGNRAAEARLRGRRLERIQSVVEYRRAAQNVVLEVKDALDGVILNYRLIEQARTSRVAAAEALRTLLVEKELTQRGYTVERLNLELSQQTALAAAERAEVNAVIDYNVAIADLYAAMGTALERNRIDFVVPDANQLLDGERAIDYRVDPAPESAGASAPAPADALAPAAAPAPSEPAPAAPPVP